MSQVYLNLPLVTGLVTQAHRRTDRRQHIHHPTMSLLLYRHRYCRKSFNKRQVWPETQYMRTAEKVQASGTAQRRHNQHPLVSLLLCRHHHCRQSFDRKRAWLETQHNRTAQHRHSQHALVNLVSCRHRPCRKSFNKRWARQKAQHLSRAKLKCPRSVVRRIRLTRQINPTYLW